MEGGKRQGNDVIIISKIKENYFIYFKTQSKLWLIDYFFFSDRCVAFLVLVLMVLFQISSKMNNVENTCYSRNGGALSNNLLVICLRGTFSTYFIHHWVS